MSVQSVSSSANNQYISTLASDFTNLQNDIQTLESAQSSGNQDQVTLSQDALQKAMTQFQTDLGGPSQSTLSAQGHHHHHHHHGMDAASADGNTASTAAIPGPTTPSSSSDSSQPQSNISIINLTA